MAVDSYIDAYTKDPSVTVKFNGNRTRDIVSVDLSQSMDALTTATIRLLSSPGVAPETKVQIQQGYNGQELTTFTGLIDAVERSNTDGAYVVQARDMLKKALDTFLVQEVKFGVDVASQTYYYSTYDSADGGTFVVHAYPSLEALHSAHSETTGNITNEGAKAEAVVQWLLHMSGLEEGSQIQVDATEFFIGDLTPAKFHLTSVYDAANQIANLIGWRLFCDQSGVCRFKKKPRNPSSFYPIWRYYDQQEPYNIHKLTRNESNVDLRTYVEVRGASGIKYTTRGTSPYLGNTPYRGVLISDELIDTPGMASFVGQRVLSDLNRLKVTVSLEADGNPKIIPGSTLDVSSYVCQGKYLVESVQTTMSAEGGYKLSTNASSFYGDTAFVEPDVEIFAEFTAITAASIGDPQYMVELDGSASYSNMGPITNYTWTMPDSSVHNNGPDATIWWVFEETTITNGSSQTVTLTVTDAVGNTATKTIPITLEWLQANTSIKYRHLYAAFNSKAVCSTDGGITWIEQATESKCISVAASNFVASGSFSASGYAVFGDETGVIYKTVDALAHIYTVHAAGSAVNDLNIPELDGSFAAAGTEGGKVLRSLDFGETWQQIGSFGFPILQVKYDYSNFQHITIVGEGLGNMYETFDDGASWGQINTGVDGLWAADSNVSNYLAHTAGIKNLSTSTEMTTGGLGPFVALTYGIEVDDSLLPGAGIMTVDSNGQHYNYSGGMVATQFNADNKTKHMIRDGEMPMLVYYATASGVGKSLNNNVTMSGLYYPLEAPPEGGWGYKIAYGPLASPIVPARLLWRGNAVSLNGWAWAGIGTSGWLQITGEGRDVPARAVSAGYAIFGQDRDIHYINVPADGIPVAHLNHFQFTGPEGFEPHVRSLHISRKIVASGTIPRVFCIAQQSNTAAVPDAYVWSNFFATPETKTIILGPQGDPGDHRARSVYPSHAIPKNKDKILFAVTQTLFSDYNRWYLYDIDKGTVDRGADKVDEGSPTASTPFPHVALTTDWWTIANSNFPGDSTNMFIKLNTGNYTSLNSVAPEQTNFIYDSSIYPSEIYVANAAGVRRISMYGTGDITTLYTVSGGVVLEAFSVTHDIAETKDYLAMALKGDGIVQMRYSTDAGVSWQNGPDMPYNISSFTNDIWYVDVR